MTNKEAIEQLLATRRLMYEENIEIKRPFEELPTVKAIDMAIKALEEVDKLKLEIFFANHTDDDVYR